MSVFILMKAFL